MWSSGPNNAVAASTSYAFRASKKACAMNTFASSVSRTFAVSVSRTVIGVGTVVRTVGVLGTVVGALVVAGSVVSTPTALEHAVITIRDAVTPVCLNFIVTRRPPERIAFTDGLRLLGLSPRSGWPGTASLGVGTFGSSCGRRPLTKTGPDERGLRAHRSTRCSHLRVTGHRPTGETTPGGGTIVSEGWGILALAVLSRRAAFALSPRGGRLGRQVQRPGPGRVDAASAGCGSCAS